MSQPESGQSDMIQDVEDFHRKFGHGLDPKPRVLEVDLFKFRHGFHVEEILEYAGEQLTIEEQRELGIEKSEVIIQSLNKQLDALCDAAWVILGTAELQFGADRFREAWRRVAAANMAKVRSDAGVEGCMPTGRDEKFDIVKPPGWVAPDHRDLVVDYSITRRFT